jgi:hypothetical protein
MVQVAFVDDSSAETESQVTADAGLLGDKAQEVEPRVDLDAPDFCSLILALSNKVDVLLMRIEQKDKIIDELVAQLKQKSRDAADTDKQVSLDTAIVVSANYQDTDVEPKGVQEEPHAASMNDSAPVDRIAWKQQRDRFAALRQGTNPTSKEVAVIAQQITQDKHNKVVLNAPRKVTVNKTARKPILSSIVRVQPRIVKPPAAAAPAAAPKPTITESPTVVVANHAMQGLCNVKVKTSAIKPANKSEHPPTEHKSWASRFGLTKKVLVLFVLFVIKFVMLAILLLVHFNTPQSPFASHAFDKSHFMADGKTLIRKGLWDSYYKRYMFPPMLDNVHSKGIFPRTLDELTQMNEAQIKDFADWYRLSDKKFKLPPGMPVTEHNVIKYGQSKVYEFIMN